MSKPKVVITDSVFATMEPERRVLGDVADLVVAQAADDATLCALTKDADAILNCYARLSPELVAGLTRCRIIARYGIGIDTIPVDDATAKGIIVTNVPDYCIDEVADHAIALLLSLARGIVPGSRATASGRWDLAAVRPLHRLRGRKLGLLGFGRIGQAVASRAKAFGLEILACDAMLSGSAINAAGATAVDFATLLQKADFVSVHVPLTSATYHLISSTALDQLRPGAVIINTSRGGTVDTAAVVSALRAGKLGGAALDVLEEEPPEDWSQLSAPGLVLTPHAAFYSEESMIELQTRAAEDVARVLRGERPRNPVNRAG